MAGSKMNLLQTASFCTGPVCLAKLAYSERMQGSCSMASSQEEGVSSPHQVLVKTVACGRLPSHCREGGGDPKHYTGEVFPPETVHLSLGNLLSPRLSMEF